jgi:hypothetical protein
MAPRAFFGPPRDAPAPGGLHVSVHIVPVYADCLVVFDVTSPSAHGRWLPWAIIDFGQNPYEAASLLVDDWCDASLDDLSLADVMSLEVPGGGWELAIIFRASLTSAPSGDHERVAVLTGKGHYDAIGAFDPVDIQRWVETSPATESSPPTGSRGLIF